MTKIKLCGLSRPCDIQTANALRPQYVGFVFAPQSSRFVGAQEVAKLKSELAPGIAAVGVFVQEDPKTVADLLNRGIIEMAQLHGDESEAYLAQLRALTDRPIIQAFRVTTEQDARKAQNSTADYILLDSGAGTGSVFDWRLIRGITRPFFLAGGLYSQNVEAAIRAVRPYAVDVSSGIETDGHKDPQKMAEFVSAVRKEDVT